jgi:hypothetical protein
VYTLIAASLCINCHLPVEEVREPGLPLDLGLWQQCVGYAQKIVCVFQHWDVSYDTQVDPMVTCVLWYTCVVLAIQAMSASLVNRGTNIERMHQETALDNLVDTLRRFSTWWTIPEKLLGKFWFIAGGDSDILRFSLTVCQNQLNTCDCGRGLTLIRLVLEILSNNYGFS